VTRPGRSVSIGCVISTSERIRAEIEWYKDERRIVDDGGVKYAISRNETKSILNITKVCEYISLCVCVWHFDILAQLSVVDTLPANSAHRRRHEQLATTDSCVAVFVIMYWRFVDMLSCKMENLSTFVRVINKCIGAQFFDSLCMCGIVEESYQNSLSLIIFCNQQKRIVPRQ